MVGKGAGGGNEKNKRSTDTQNTTKLKRYKYDEYAFFLNC